MNIFLNKYFFFKFRLIQKSHIRIKLIELFIKYTKSFNSWTVFKSLFVIFFILRIFSKHFFFLHFLRANFPSNTFLLLLYRFVSHWCVWVFAFAYEYIFAECYFVAVSLFRIPRQTRHSTVRRKPPGEALMRKKANPFFLPAFSSQASGYRRQRRFLTYVYPVCVNWVEKIKQKKGWKNSSIRLDEEHVHTKLAEPDWGTENRWIDGWVFGFKLDDTFEAKKLFFVGARLLFRL